MNKSGRLIPGLLLILTLGCTALGFFLLTASPASAVLFATAVPTHENLWAQGDLPKPTYTPISLPADVAVTPQVSPELPVTTETAVAFSMEIVENAFIPPVQAEGPQAPAPMISTGGKYILVDMSEQHLYAYENDGLVFSFVASTGINNATRTGIFAVQTKLDNAYGATWNIWMPNWLGIYYSGSLENGIHALPILPNGAILWEGYLGRPVSYGCVVLGTYESKLLYDWAEMGTPVEIQW